MKTHYVDELVKSPRDTQFRSAFRLDGVVRGITKYGKPYLRFRLIDRTGSISAKWWDCGDAASEKPLPSNYAVVSGRVESREEGVEINLTAAPEWIPCPANASDYELLAPLMLSDLTARLEGHIGSVASKPLRALLKKIFCDNAFRKQFDAAPAAETMHHACRHGLLQHTVEVADLAAAIADVQQTWGYRPVNRDLAVTGALLHDIGKIDELGQEGDGIFGVTPRGHFLGHIVTGMQRVNRAINQTPDFPADLRDIVLHVILAHHGKREWGSPVTPALTEAQIVHMADHVDVQLFYLQEAAAASPAEFARVSKLGGQRVYTPSIDDIVRGDDNPGGKVREDRPMLITARGDEPCVGWGDIASPHTPRRLPIFRTIAAPSVFSEKRFVTRRIPLVGRAAAGSPVLAEEHIEEYLDIEADELPADAELYLLRVAGESMNGDGIHDGDLVIVRKQSLHQPQDIVVVYLTDRDEAAIKRLVRQSDGTVRLESSNPHIAPMIVGDPGGAQVHGRVLGIVPRGRAEADLK